MQNTETNVRSNCPLKVIYDRLQTSPETLASFCEKWQIVELALFGSVLRDEFRTNGENASDIDLLFTWAEGVSQSLLKRVKIKYELEKVVIRVFQIIE